MALNQCTFLGRLTRDPEIRYVEQSDKVIAKFTVAVDRIGLKDGTTGADFIPCVAFDGRAEFAERFLRQGMRVLVGGKLRNNNYTNKDGQKIYRMEVCANIIEFADGKPGNEDAEEPMQENNAPANPQPGNCTAAASRGRTAGAAGRNRSAAQERPASGRRAAQTRASGRTTSRTSSRASAYQGDTFMNIQQQTEDDLPFLQE